MMSNVETTDHTGEHTGAAVTIVYDGDCPFCTNYVQLVRLRENLGSVEMVDARGSHPILEDVRAQGFDLNAGMVVRIDARYYYGAEAMTALSLMSTRVGVFNRIMGALFRNPGRAAKLYPFMVRGRNLTLRLLGRQPIGG